MTTTARIPALTAATFDEAVGSAEARRPLVVDFWAEWCPPCTTLAPILDELAAELAGTVDFAAVDVEAHPTLATRYSVLAFPTLLVFAGDATEPIGRLTGLRGRQHLREELSRLTTPRG